MLTLLFVRKGKIRRLLESTAAAFRKSCRPEAAGMYAAMTELPKAHAERGDEWQICRRDAKPCQRDTTGLGKTNMTPAQPHKTTV